MLWPWHWDLRVRGVARRLLPVAAAGVVPVGGAPLVPSPPHTPAVNDICCRLGPLTRLAATPLVLQAGDEVGKGAGRALERRLWVYEVATGLRGPLPT